MKKYVENFLGGYDKINLSTFYEEYIKYPSITKQRMFYETMEDILPDMKVIIEGANGSQIQQLLPLDSFNTAEATEE